MFAHATLLLGVKPVVAASASAQTQPSGVPLPAVLPELQPLSIPRHRLCFGIRFRAGQGLT